MSLRIIHIFVILVSVIFSFSFGAWGVRDWREGGPQIHLVLGALSAAAGSALVFYLVFFVKKTRQAGLR